MQREAVAVIDFGGQYAHLIAAKIRRQKVLAEICQPEEPVGKFKQYKGIILSGSPALSAFGEDSNYTKEIFDLEIPILGFCFGHQEIAKHYGGEVIHGNQEWGHAVLHIKKSHPLFKGLKDKEQVWMSHFDTVVAVGPGFEELGYTTLGESGRPHHFAAIGSDELKRYGFQFHPEVDDTVNGEVMLKNFVCDICGCEESWTMEGYLSAQMKSIKEQVKDNSVFLLVSGGVDSTVAALLISKAIGLDRLHLLHVNNGLMRKNESLDVLETLKNLNVSSNIHFVDASERFLNNLSDSVEPEDKRRIIGETFIKVFEEESKRLGLENHLLGQGTIYPDTVETGGTRRAKVIKTHHNRVPVIEKMIAAGRVIEPLADLYKSEVRELGEMLGLTSGQVWRHPFPGPGFGVRLLCSADTSDETCSPKQKEMLDGILSKTALKGFFLPLKSVGVKADLRSHEQPVLLAGTADRERLMELTGEILKTVPGVNRCVLALSPQNPSLFTRLKASVTRERLAVLREADALVMDALGRYRLERKIWQCPTVLAPMSVDGRGSEFCIIRPVYSKRAMTAAAASLPDELLAELCESILKLSGISGLGLDLTSKPPGTIEWE